MRATTKLISSAVVMLVSAGVLAGCSDSSFSDGSSSQTSSASSSTPSVVAPIMVPGRSGAGQEYEVLVGGTVVFSVPEDTLVTDWTGATTDKSIVSFRAGSDDGSATFNPSWTALAEGTADVTMTDANGEEVPFTINVVPAP